MSLRKRKNRKYNEETNDEEEGGRRFSIQEQIRSERFDQDKERHLQELRGDSITLKLVQRNGFEKPILVKEPDGLDLHVPPRNFLVRDVRDCVGHDRIIDVMDVRTQKNIEMSMKDWCKYYESKHRDRLLNVISLEFSHTKLDELVEAPKIVKLLDWVDLVWPKFLKESQTESTNSIDKMKYPKVQKYCLMSVKGSYTDFHIDFGGTSVWYHIIKGKKIFWMVPPTELNLQTFEEWTLSGMQQDVFFGDTVEECFRVELVAGNTFFIPSGWIHAVYTVEDSLVFGGNFLHSFGIENQLRVSKIEDATKVPIKFRYPFYTEIQWYVVQHYVHCLTGKDHLHRPEPSVLDALENTAKAKGAKKACVKNRDDDDGTTESDISESDTKKKHAKQPVKRKKSTPQTNKPSKKKSQKPATDDDESTEIDSAYEDDYKQVDKKSTRRPTRNSRSRLESEVEEEAFQRILQLSIEESKREQKKIKAESLKKFVLDLDQQTTSASNEQRQDQTNAGTSATSSTPIVGDATMPQHESPKLNGWSSNTVAQNTWSNSDKEPEEPLKIHVTKIEINGLKLLVKHLSKLSGAKKNLPALIRNSRVLLDDCRKLIAEHENDNPELAITGKPITIDLLNPKKTNINDLIDQFFKPTQTTESDSSLNSTPHSASIKSDSMTLTHQQRLKLNLSTDDKKTSVQNDALWQSPKSSPQKETKCLSPNKKATGIMPSPSSSSSPALTPTTPTPRPKSPPTRPLSNNQYTSSRTKQTINNSNQILLPGSFADLIAATSTEKKVFEVSSSEVTSSIFGLKDVKPLKSNFSAAKPIPTKDKSNISPQNKPSTSHGPDSHVPPSLPHTSEQPIKSTPAPISPEPSKVNPQKRFINPAFRPPVKEKLIYASAPYVSPVHTTEQSRSNNFFSWQNQTPHSQPNQTGSQQLAQSFTNKHAIDQSNSQYQNRSTNPGPDARDHSSESMSVKDTNQDLAPQPMSVIQKPNHTSTNPKQTDTAQEVSLKTNQLAETVSSEDARRATQVSETIRVSLPSSSKLVDQGPNSATLIANGNDQTSKKQTKPRGPPKKSKEAREVMDAVEAKPTPIIVDNDMPAPAESKSEEKPEKPKSKRPKKQKKNDLPVPEASTSTTPASGLNLTTQPQIRPPVICGLVAPPVSTSVGAKAAKVNPQQYLISRPLLYNGLPAFSSAQFQPLSRAPVPLLSTSSIPSSLGFTTMQPGARIVWATQSPKSSVATTDVNGRVAQTTTVASTQIPKFGLLAAPRFQANPSTSAMQPDNAALLSLATTALSTAPMPSTPTLSHIGIGQPASQAIMVGSGSQPTLLTGQQLYSSLMAQRMPMTPFIAQGHGGPRPSGQLVFARLPNQGQPRYLITPPGFMAQQNQTPLLASQPGSTLAFAAYRPPAPAPVVQNSAKPMKPKKVKTH